jgi:putative redox protein
MKATATWTEGLQGIVKDERNHSIVIDVPPTKGGTDSGTSALELCVMSFAGCIETIFAMVAPKMRLEFEKLEVVADARIEEGSKTLSHIDYKLRIKTEVSEEKVKKCLVQVEKTCPVGVLFTQAGLILKGEIEML